MTGVGESLHEGSSGDVQFAASVNVLLAPVLLLVFWIWKPVLPLAAPAASVCEAFVLTTVTASTGVVPIDVDPVDEAPPADAVRPIDPVVPERFTSYFTFTVVLAPCASDTSGFE